MTSQAPFIQLSEYKGARNQSLRNVYIHAPTIIWVQQGYKRLAWQDDIVVYDNSQWVMLSAGQYINFSNIPAASAYHALCLSLLAPVPTQLRENIAQNKNNVPPMFTPSKALRELFLNLGSSLYQSLCENAQYNMLMAFYEQLAHDNGLALLFPNEQDNLSHKLARYLSISPGQNHDLETVAHHLNMSRASLHRKLRHEGNSFRTLLTDIRMNYALNLLQKGLPLVDVALASGYESPERFSSRFKKQYGFSPKTYAKTL